MSRPFKLYRLQQIDSQIDWINSRLRDIEAALKDDAELRQAMADAEKAEKDLQVAHKALRKAETDVQQQRLKIEQSDSTLYGGKVRNPKELQDLQNEIAALKRFLGTLEDRQLEAMMVEEDAEAAKKAREAELEATRAKSAQKSSNLTVEKGKNLKDLNRFQDERQAVISTIQAEDLRLYGSLREKRHGIAVAKVADRACSACGSTLSAVLLHAVHSPNEVNRCENCGRILYLG